MQALVRTDTTSTAALERDVRARWSRLALSLDELDRRRRGILALGGALRRAAIVAALFGLAWLLAPRRPRGAARRLPR